MNWLNKFRFWRRRRHQAVAVSPLMRHLEAVPARAAASADPTHIPARGPAQALPSGRPPRSPFQADARKQAIRQGFNASQPVSSVRQLHGREEELDLLVEGMLDRGNHGLIFGARGSGKTSLSRVFANIADERGYVVMYSACEPDQSFGEIIHPFIAGLPRSCFSYPDAQRILPDRDTKPRAAAEMLADCDRSRVIFILDEFDRILDRDVQHDVATFMKLLSDTHSPVQLLAVGIASGLDHLIEGHPSLRRHLSPIGLRGVDTDAVFAIINKGAQSANISFTDATIETISSLSCGSPYHVRLFCALAAYEALKRGEQQVDVHATLSGIGRALADWAMTNEDDAALFRRVTTHEPQLVQAVEDVARAAARRANLSAEGLRASMGEIADHALAMLAPVLEWHETDSDRLNFRDSLAPQFLLVTLCMSQASRHPDNRVVSITEPVRQMHLH
ncbi:MAG: ATP-binding protein [Sphingobium sp.]